MGVNIDNKFLRYLTLIVFFGSCVANRHTIKDVMTVVQRIEDKLDREDRLREITDIVHLDASVDKINKKLDGVLSILEGNGLPVGRISDGRSAPSVDNPSSEGRLEAIDGRLDRLEKLAGKIANGFENADFGKLAAIDRNVNQLQSDMNKKLQKMMNVVTSLYEMNKEMKTNNVGGRSSSSGFQSMSDPGLFIIEGLEELERKIKEQMSILSNDIRSEITSLKITAGGIGDCAGDYDELESSQMPKQQQSSANKRSSSAKRDALAPNKEGLDNRTLDAIILRLGRSTDEIKREINKGMQTIDSKLTNLSEKQRICGKDVDPHQDLEVAESVRDSRKIDVSAFDPQELGFGKDDIKKEKSCSRIAKNVESPKSCYELRRGGATCDGVYVIFPNHTRAVRVYCDMTTDGGGWTVIMRRGDFGSKMTSFHKNWVSYKNGFGDVEGEFWLGNDAIHLLSSRENNSVLRVYLEAFDGDNVNLTYSSFFIEDETNRYRLHLGPSVETPTPVSNSLKYHNNHPFSTYDRKNDGFEQNCAATYKGGWWFNGCYFGFLTGEYFGKDEKRENWQGMLWYDWKGNAALSGAHMMIRSPGGV